MNVNASSSMQHMHKHGAGGGAGNGGMKDIMQSLSQEDRSAMREKMSSLSQADRQSMISQMKQVDATSMSSADYAQTLLEMVGQRESEKSTASVSGFSAYA